ncbi:MAG TPA: sigma-70 family RNA polymerase sigma factor [Rhizobiaceae bacterium]
MTDPSGPARDDASIIELLPALRAFARTFYRDSTDADDLVQETLVRALKSFDSFEPNTRLKSWMFTIMRNTFYTRVKISSREAPGTADCVAARPAVEASQEWSVRSREVHEAINRLPPYHREVLVLIGVLGISYEETAEICGCAIGTVKSRLNRARLHILDELGETSASSLVEKNEKLSNASFTADADRRRSA